jgi:AbrB family looped-hinge helix DNA binding protein
MDTTLLSSRGQVVIPKGVRDAQAWKPGARLSVTVTEAGVLLAPLDAAVKVSVAEGLAQVRGALNYSGRKRSLEDMDAAVLLEAKRRHTRTAN